MTDSRTLASAVYGVAAGFMTSKLLAAVTAAGVPDAIGDDTRSIREIAEATGSHPAALARFLRHLKQTGLFEAEDGDHYRLTDRGQLLRSDVPGSMRGMVLMLNDAAYLGWSMAPHTLATNEAAFPAFFGKDFFSWLDDNPDAARIFHAAMVTRPGDLALLVDAIDMSGVTKVADIGGGNGHLLSAILARYPGTSGILVDMAEAIAAAEAAQGGPLPNTDLVVGNFFEAVPSGADLYILHKILHDWSDEDCTRILDVCRRAMRTTDRLVILDLVVTPEQPEAFLSDVYMLVQSGGRERTEAEFARLLQNAGFVMASCRQTGGRLGLVEARIASDDATARR